MRNWEWNWYWDIIIILVLIIISLIFCRKTFGEEQTLVGPVEIKVEVYLPEKPEPEQEEPQGPFGHEYNPYFDSDTIEYSDIENEWP